MGLLCKIARKDVDPKRHRRIGLLDAAIFKCRSSKGVPFLERGQIGIHRSSKGISRNANPFEERSDPFRGTLGGALQSDPQLRLR